jgi:phage terminase Nu1 subunit (DNA packaging protein)
MFEITSETLVTDASLAAVIGVAPRQIRRYAEAGTIERDERNAYKLADAVQALMAEAAGSGSALTRARTKKVEAEATMAELELAKSRGEVAFVSEFEECQAQADGILRAGMLNIPQRVVQQLLGETNEVRFKKVLRTEIVLALNAARDAIGADQAQAGKS